MLRINPAMLPRVAELETDLLARRDRASAEGWLGEIEGIDLTLRLLREKQATAERIQATSDSAVVDLGLPASRSTTRRGLAGLGLGRDGLEQVGAVVLHGVDGRGDRIDVQAAGWWRRHQRADPVGVVVPGISHASQLPGVTAIGIRSWMWLALVVGGRW